MELAARIVVEEALDPPVVRAHVTMDGTDLMPPTEVNTIADWLVVLEAISQAAGVDLRPALQEAFAPLVRRIEEVMARETERQARREHALEQWGQLLGPPGTVART